MRTPAWLSAAVIALTFATGSARAAEPVNANGSVLALGGYDVVAYLNYSKDVQQLWEKDIPGHARKADTNWPGVLAR